MFKLLSITTLILNLGLFYNCEANENLSNLKEFRINKGTQTKDGYAVAWGIPGIKLDFEYLDKLPENEKYKFLENNNLKNFIVDVHNHKIITTIIDEELVKGSLEDYNFGAYFSMHLEQVEINGIDKKGLLVFSNYKHGNSISKFILLNANDPIVIEGELIKTQLRDQIEDLLTPNNRDFFRNSTETITEIRSKYLNGKFSKYNYIHFSYAIPHGNGDGLEVVAKTSFTFKNNKIEVKVHSITQENI